MGFLVAAVLLAVCAVGANALKRYDGDIEEEAERLAARQRIDGKAINYDEYNNYTDIVAELDALVARCPSAVICSIFSIGNSYEGRDIKGIRITRPGAGRKGIWLDATIHAREWLATATLLKIIKHLIDDYAADKEVHKLVDTYDWHLLPILNPDGYEFSWTDDRLWHKNRSPNENTNCSGTDLNKNFDEHWGNAGTSTSPCTNNYGGTGPASEVETQAVQKALLSLGGSLLTSFHMHTFGQMWLIPWGSVDALGNCSLTSDHAELMEVANAGADAAGGTYGTKWKRGTSCSILYPGSGITMDYSKARAGIKYTTTVHLRGNSSVSAPDQIEPSFQEFWNGLTATISAISQQTTPMENFPSIHIHLRPTSPIP